MAPQLRCQGFGIAPSKSILSKRPRVARTPDSEKQPGKRQRTVELSEEEEARRKRRREVLEVIKAQQNIRMLVAIDFGTTHSGIAIVLSTQTPKEVEVIETWTGPGNRHEPKVPTRIAYPVENEQFSQDEVRWGNTVRPGDTIVQWFKLLLDANTKKSDFDDNLLHECLGQGLLRLPACKDAKEVTTDFLRFLYQHLMQYLEKKITKAAIDETRFRFLVTVPSAWSYAAREATRAAAKDAGFGSQELDEVVLVDEAEASAIWAVHSMDKLHARKTFVVGSCMMICDWGGGTIDLVTYLVLSLDPLQLEEACVGQGGKVGGTAIDRALHALMTERFGDAFTSIPAKRIGPKSDFMEAFEKVKRDFAGKANDSSEYWLPLRLSRTEENKSFESYYDSLDLKVKITADDLEAMFEPALEKSFGLIQDQVRRTDEAHGVSTTIGTIVLSGGMGENPYVYARTKQFVNDTFGEGTIAVPNPFKSWSAVARGAAIHALLKDPVMSRRARDHIGMRVHVPFRAKKHHIADRFQCAITKKWRAQNQMKWFFHKDERISSKVKKIVRCYTVFENTERGVPEAIANLTLHRCSKDKAPERLDESIVYEIGTIKIDLTKQVKQERDRIRGETGKNPREVGIEVCFQITVSTCKGVMEATAKIGRKKVGGTTIEYVPDSAWQQGLVHREDDDESDEENEGEEVNEVEKENCDDEEDEVEDEESVKLKEEME